jgi:hypothetical protein
VEDSYGSSHRERFSLKLRTRIAGTLVLAFVGSGVLLAQEPELVKEALQDFPPETVRVEYSNPAKLRKLPNYASLRQRYLGEQLRNLEESLAKLGVQENEVDELMTGWGKGGGKVADFYGLAEGRFDAQAIANRAATAKVKPVPMGGAASTSAYCLAGDGSTEPSCVVVLSNSLGAFGTLKSLGLILHARNGGSDTLAMDEHLKALAAEDTSEAPIWGVAVGPAVVDWFKHSMPGQDSLELDWSQAFADVQALAYTIDAADQVHLDLKLDCTTPQAAMNLRQLLDGLRSFQQLAWPTQHPNEPNPFRAVEVDSSGQRVNLKMTTPYPAA